MYVYCLIFTGLSLYEHIDTVQIGLHINQSLQVTDTIKTCPVVLKMTYGWAENTSQSDIHFMYYEQRMQVFC
jgi:hypothetical protein